MADDLGGATVRGTERLNTAQLEALSRVPGNVVYTYDYDLPEGTMPPAEQLAAARGIIVRFDGLTHVHPSEPAEALRERTLNADPAFRTFSRLYPAVFARLTQLAVDEEGGEGEAEGGGVTVRELDMLRKGVLVMLEARAAAKGPEEVNSEALKAAVLSRMMSMCVRDVRPDDMEQAHKVALDCYGGGGAGEGGGAAAAAAGAPPPPPLTRLDPAEVSAGGQVLVSQRPGCAALRSAPMAL